MQGIRPYTLSFAGFDPSGGAGILADIKTFEACGTYGLGVITANTIQNESSFERVEWVSIDIIKKQIDIILDKYTVWYFKIGITQNLAMLNAIITHIKSRVKEACIIWDPVLRASAGYTFIETVDRDVLRNALSHIFLVTPNRDEAQQLFPGKHNPFLSVPWAVLLKGGHAEGHADDILYYNDKEIILQGDRIEGYAKHGTGCVLSAAICAQLAQGASLEDACKNAKEYVRRFLQSNNGLLGYHDYSFNK